jgi:hypothetical protein
MTIYVVRAYIDAAEYEPGYCVEDYFDGDVLDREYTSEADAEAALRAAYRGAVDGVGAVWFIDAV